MIDRFTNEARRTISLAHEETERLRRSAIHTDTFLVALLQIPEGLGVEAIRGAMREGGESGRPQASSLSEDARNAMKRAQLESRRLEHGFIGTEHLLLALLDDEEGVASQLLRSLSVDFNELRQDILSRMPGTPEGSFDMSKRHNAWLSTLRQ